MTKIYLVPGLGNDVRIFSKLIPLLEGEGKEIVCLEHKEPLSLNETIPAYAKRMVECIPKTAEPPVLIGMSLGGTIATEMSKLMPLQKLILISTFKHKSEVPFLFKIARILPLHLLVPAWFIRIVIPFFARILGICNREDTQTLRAMLYACTASHFAWGRRAIVAWDNETYPSNFIHINGTKDHIFNLRQEQITHTIKNGTHNMVMDRAAEIATIIHREALG
ncbi:alpha/beta hydrolase [Aureispira anguillae]|uniref:Alpha/beta hydrolase n=1 Tax=Aureispira anguillae TaxID=2864201 RepID=A0A915YEQ3_9BACT|nr:alpha/beta hydrolase [Aureispira anguillae]BDS11643.1 alpha/beta hydrolase [Aureispira anguillae]